MTIKKCSKCKSEKNIDNFTISKHRKDGRNPWCTDCCREYYNKNKLKIRIQHEIYLNKNRDKILEKKREYFTNHREEKQAYDKIYRSKNKEKIASYKKNWEKRTREIPKYKILRNLRRRLIHVLRGSVKCDKTLNLLGCDMKFLLKYLESKFKENMSWDNYGLHGWHIDHIKPCSSFDLTKEDEQRKCFHYTNLQPLWAKDNLEKSDKQFD